MDVLDGQVAGQEFAGSITRSQVDGDRVLRLHHYRVRVHLDEELRIPLVPQAVLGYMSIYPLLWAPAFILRTRRELRALALTLAAVIFIAGIFFVLVPVEAAFPPPGARNRTPAPHRSLHAPRPRA